MYDDLKMAIYNFFKSQPADFCRKGTSDMTNWWEKAIPLCGEYIVNS